MDEMYIKMCVAGQDILRKDWIPKAGDRVLTRWNSDKHKLEIDYYSKDFVTKEASVLLHKRTDVWLPRQSDLQRIKMNQYGHTPWAILTRFNSWYNDLGILTTTRGKDFPDCMTPITTLWLMFVMETMYNKQWNMETQTWETTQ